MHRGCYMLLLVSEKTREKSKLADLLVAADLDAPAEGVAVPSVAFLDGKAMDAGDGGSRTAPTRY